MLDFGTCLVQARAILEASMFRRIVFLLMFAAPALAVSVVFPGVPTPVLTTDSYVTPRHCIPVAGVATITKNLGTMVVLNLTNSPTVLTFADDWTTNEVGMVSLDVSTGTNALTLSNRISWTTSPTFSTTNATVCLFRKNYGTTNWVIRQ